MPKDRLGLSFDERWLVWNGEGGAMRGWPEWIKGLIVTVWNRTMCLFGHRRIGALGGPFRNDCLHCGQRVKERLWQRWVSK